MNSLRGGVTCEPIYWCLEGTFQRFQFQPISVIGDIGLLIWPSTLGVFVVFLLLTRSKIIALNGNFYEIRL